MDESMRGALPSPVEDGTGTYGSRGRVIDGLMGDRRIRQTARREVEDLVLRSQVGSDTPLPPDPPPVDLPPPVPGGTGTETKGRRLGGARPRPAG
ncbi:hypothetical protein BH23ACT12_BH23ACT12_04810 [soil metagenome]